MSKGSSGSGADFLNKKSRLIRDNDKLDKPADIVVIDDEPIDAERLLATLRIIFGYEVSIRLAATLNAAIELVMAKIPDVIFLDDILKPADDATHTIPFLRRAGYGGAIIVISGQVTRQRRPVLIAAGATEVIHKDDVDSVRLSEILQKLGGAVG